MEVIIIITAAPITTEEINSKVDQTKEDGRTTPITITVAVLAAKEAVITITIAIAIIEARVEEIEVVDEADLKEEVTAGLMVIIFI